MGKTVQRSNMTQTDSKGNVIRAPRDSGEEAQAVNYKWWTADEVDMAQAITGTVLFIMNKQNERLAQLTQATRLYGNTAYFNLAGSAFGRARSSVASPASARVSYNVTQAIIDTLESKMAKNEVVPTWATNGGNWSNQKKAKQLTQFNQGLFYKQHVHKKVIHAFKDSSIWGDGFVQVKTIGKEIVVERAFPHNLFVDMLGSLSHAPNQLHYISFIEREIAKERYPELAEAIDLVAPADYQEIGGVGTVSDLIKMIESWHIKTSKESEDGMYVVTVGDSVQINEWDEEYFPFPQMKYCKRQLGFYGAGVCERVQNLQAEINTSMILKQRSHRMMASFKLLVENGSKVVSQHLDNEVGTIVKYSSVPPQYVTPPATNPDLQMWIDTLINYAFQQEGISKMSSTGEAPLGVESGKAMRTLVQISDDRFAFISQQLEEFTLEIAKQMINLAKKIYGKGDHYEVIYPDKKFVQTIDWADIDLGEEEYVLKAFPTSSLSDDLTGRLSEVQEMAQAGFMSPRTARRLLDMPDVEAQDALANAAEDRLHQMYEKMLDDKQAFELEPSFHDLSLAQQLGIQYVNYAEYMGAPEANINIVIGFLNQVNQAQAQIQAALAPPPGAPGAVPNAPPQSNLLPNAPQAGAQ